MDGLGCSASRWAWPEVTALFALRVHWLFLRRRLAGALFRLTHLFRGVIIESDFCVEGGSNITLERGVVVQRRSVFTVSADGRLFVGQDTRIGSDAVIAVAQEVVLGRNVLIAARCFICDHNHRFGDPNVPVMHQGPATPKPVRIEEGAWLGINVSVLPGAHIGRNCVVGANSVVIGDVPDGTVVAGVPARVIRTRHSHGHTQE